MMRMVCGGMGHIARREKHSGRKAIEKGQLSGFFVKKLLGGREDLKEIAFLPKRCGKGGDGGEGKNEVPRPEIACRRKWGKVR